MEALGARQLERQKSTVAKSAKADTSNLPPPTQSAKERLELNRILGFADPPAQVFALGKEECAAVWWSEVEDESIIAWEVHRFRKDKSRPEADIWHYKGFTTFTNLLKPQTVINQLTNDFEYRFTVKAVNSKGSGTESAPSNPVMVEKPLPTGWHRFLDPASKRHYYANIRLGVSSWTRPEQDPWFLDESILLLFDEREMAALKDLYREEIAHFKCVSVEQFLDVLREVGERCSKGWITQLFRGYAGSEKELRSWKHFMEVMAHIKRYRTCGGVVVQNPLEKLMSFFRRKKIGALLQPKTEKMGDWVIEYSSLAERNYYRNTKTGESHWSMPPQVKFYIPPRLEDKLLLVFDYGDLEEFQQYFSLLDVDNSGDLSAKEIRILLKALDLQISELKFSKLIKTVDLNGNGTIEFDEFCWMMLQIFRKDNSGIWQDMRSQSRALALSMKPPPSSSPGAKAAASGREEDLQPAGGADDSHDGNSLSGGALGLSAGSLENSLFGDSAWGDKLSYSKVRGVLGAMKHFAQTGRATGGRKSRFSLSSGGGSFRGGSFLSGVMRRMSRSDSFGRQSFVNGITSESAGQQGAAPARGVLFCLTCCRKPGRNHGSKLNQILSSYDESAELPAGSLPGAPSAPYYPAASFRSSAADPANGRYRAASDAASVATFNAAASTAGTVGSGAGAAKGRIESAMSTAPAGPAVSAQPKAGRRVSFSHSGYDAPATGAAANMLSSDKSVASGGTSVNGSPALQSRKSLPGSVSDEGSLSSSKKRDSIKKERPRKQNSLNRRSSSASAASDAKEQEDEDGDVEEEGQGGAASRSSGGSLLKRMTSFASMSLGGDSANGDGDSSGGPNKAHPKHCMCGCRAY